MTREASRVERYRALAVVVLFVLAASVSMAYSSDFVPQEATIAGMVQGIDKDSDGNPQRVCIQDDNLGSPVLVVADEKGKELLGLVGSQVEATGTLEHTDEATVEGYDFQIRIKTYKVPD